MRTWQRRLSVVVLALLAVILIGPYLIPLPAQAEVDPATLAPADGEFLTVAGTRTWVQLAGPADGPAVVLVHGFGGSTFTWRYTLPILARAGYRVLALDLRGFGLAEKRFTDDFSHAAQADFVADTMTAVGIQRAILVGHSMGGSVIAHFAVRHPDRVAGLAFVDAAVQAAELKSADSGGRSPLGVPAWLGAAAGFPPFQRWGQLFLRTYLTRDRLAEIQRSAYFRTDLVTPEVVDGYLKILQLKDWDLALLGVLRDGGRNLLTQPLSTFKWRTLVLWGEHDPWIPAAQGLVLRGALPASEWIMLQGAGHLPMEEAPEVFLKYLLAYLGRASGQ